MLGLTSSPNEKELMMTVQLTKENYKKLLEQNQNLFSNNYPEAAINYFSAPPLPKLEQDPNSAYSSFSQANGQILNSGQAVNTAAINNNLNGGLPILNSNVLKSEFIRF